MLDRAKVVLAVLHLGYEGISYVDFEKRVIEWSSTEVVREDTDNLLDAIELEE